MCAINQATQYFQMSYDDDDYSDCFTFCQRHEINLDKLCGPALRALSVPAPSAPVERIFSHGGVIVRPRWFAMNSRTLAPLMLLKSNSNIK